jgi:4-hydroxybutyrate dehydrogenase
VLRFNADVAPAKYEALRHALGLAEGTDLPTYIEGLNARIGLPRSLSDMGLTRDVFDAMANAALADHSTATNPRPVAAEDFRRLLEEAF